jgi:hypothetical protein
VGPFHLAVGPWGGGLEVDVAGAVVQDLPVEAGAELGPVVGLDDLDPEREPLQHLVPRQATFALLTILPRRRSRVLRFRQAM